MSAETSAAPASPDSFGASSLVPTYRRIVVKAGASVLTGNANQLDAAVMAQLVRRLAVLQKAGREVLR